MLFFLLACAKSDGTPEIAWDHVACDECGMLVGEPASAAVLVERDGTQRSFDDPGCLFRFVLDKHPRIAKMWFHDGSTWYREGEVAFTVGGPTPMGSQLHAVPAGTPGAVTVGEASSRVVSK